MPVLRVLAWADYAIPSINELFERSTDVRVECELFDQNEDAHARLAAAPDRYDVVFADGHWPAHYLAHDLVQPLRTADCQSWPDVDPAIAEWCSTELWPAGEDAIAAYPANWGIRGLISDPARGDACDSWASLWTIPTGRLWLNSQGSEVLAETALAAGLRAAEIYDLTDDRLDVVAARLVELAPGLGGIWSLLPELEDAFASHGAWVAEVHTTALVSNLEWKLGRSLDVTIPSEGTIGYLDGAMVTAASSIPELAAAFIDLLFSPKGVEAQWAESDGYPPASAAGRERLSAEPRYRAKLERAERDLPALRACQLYRPATDVAAYLIGWKTVLKNVNAPVPPEVLKAVGL